MSKKPSRFFDKFNVSRKFIEAMDDLLSAVRSLFYKLRLLGPFILGVVGFLAHLGEGVQGGHELYTAYKDKQARKRFVRIAIAILTLLCAGVGFGLAIALIAAGLGAAVSAATILSAPILVPALLTVICFLSLIRKAILYFSIRREEAAARQKAYAQSATESFLNFRGTPEEIRSNLQRYKKERLVAECELAFSAVEAAASAIVLISIILGAAALIGASAASFGIAPTVLLITGVVIGLFCKLFEYLNKKNDFSYTQSLRDWFMGKGKGKGKEEVPACNKKLSIKTVQERFVASGEVELTQLTQNSRPIEIEYKIPAASPKTDSSQPLPEPDPDPQQETPASFKH